MFKRMLGVAAAILLSACATVAPSVPESYKGPTVVLLDSGQQDSGGKGVFFAAVAIDGKDIENSLRETRGASYGKGFALTSLYTARLIPVQAMKVKLVGTHQTAAPIHEIAARMAGTFFSVEGIVSFNPVAERSYVVLGELSKEKSCVWIADSKTDEVATEKVCTK
jgi:hypothetical protein